MSRNCRQRRQQRHKRTERGVREKNGDDDTAATMYVRLSRRHLDALLCMVSSQQLSKSFLLLLSWNLCSLSLGKITTGAADLNHRPCSECNTARWQQQHGVCGASNATSSTTHCHRRRRRRRTPSRQSSAGGGGTIPKLKHNGRRLVKIPQFAGVVVRR